jgi:hypothetical protein
MRLRVASSAVLDHPVPTIFGTGKRLGVAVQPDQFRYIGSHVGTTEAMLIGVIADPSESKNLIDDPKFAKVREELSAVARKHASGAK